MGNAYEIKMHELEKKV